MRFGVCTWIFDETPLKVVAAHLAGMGYEGVELFGDPDEHPARDVRPMLRDRGLKVLSLTPKDVDLAHPEPNVRRSAQSYYERLIDYAGELGAPMIGCHGAVGRIRAIDSQKREEELFHDEVRRVAERAERAGIQVCLEVLNRYESHLLNRAAQARRMVDQIDSPALGILLDTYHMNIEEQDLVEAVKSAGERLFLLHAADSNRRAIGRGHVPFEALYRTLGEMRYEGDIVVECVAPGPDPFTPTTDGDWREAVFSDVRESLEVLRRLRG